MKCSLLTGLRAKIDSAHVYPVNNRPTAVAVPISYSRVIWLIYDSQPHSVCPWCFVFHSVFSYASSAVWSLYTSIHSWYQAFLAQEQQNKSEWDTRTTTTLFLWPLCLLYSISTLSIVHKDTICGICVRNVCAREIIYIFGAIPPWGLSYLCTFSGVFLLHRSNILLLLWT